MNWKKPSPALRKNQAQLLPSIQKRLNINEAFMKKLFLLFGLLVPALSQAQSYSIDWYKVSGGGGTSTNGQYAITGTIGQHDAGGPMTSGSYSLTGGFWS